MDDRKKAMIVPDDERVLNVLLDEVDDEADLMQCAKYVELAEFEHKPITQVAVEMGIGRATLYRWRNRWKQSGLLKKTRKALMEIMIEDSVATDNYVLQQWDAVVRRVVEIATDPEANHNASIKAAEFLQEFFMTRLMAQADEPGVEEIEFVKVTEGDPKKFSPTDV
jgi:transposase-like protein